MGCEWDVEEVGEVVGDGGRRWVRMMGRECRRRWSLRRLCRGKVIGLGVRW